MVFGYRITKTDNTLAILTAAFSKKCYFSKKKAFSDSAMQHLAEKYSHLSKQSSSPIHFSYFLKKELSKSRV